MGGGCPMLFSPQSCTSVCHCRAGCNLGHSRTWWHFQRSDPGHWLWSQTGAHLDHHSGTAQNLDKKDTQTDTEKEERNREWQSADHEHIQTQKSSHSVSQHQIFIPLYCKGVLIELWELISGWAQMRAGLTVPLYYLAVNDSFSDGEHN